MRASESNVDAPVLILEMREACEFRGRRKVNLERFDARDIAERKIKTVIETRKLSLAPTRKGIISSSKILTEANHQLRKSSSTRLKSALEKERIKRRQATQDLSSADIASRKGNLRTRALW